jgi:hypothetical protein
VISIGEGAEEILAKASPPVVLSQRPSHLAR